MRRYTIPLAVVGLVSMTAACGSDDPITVETRSTATTATTEAPATTEAVETTVAPTTTAEPTTTIPEVDPVGFFDSIFNGDLNDPESLYAGAAPGSPAALYGAHQVNLRVAFRDAGEQDPVASQITRDGDTVVTCNFDDFGEVVDECTNFAGFVVDNGALYTFTVDDLTIEDRLGGEGETASAVGVDARTLTSYRSASSDFLFVVVEFTASVDVSLSLFGSTYVDANGRQVEATNSIGPNDLRGGATARGVFIFPQVDTGGTLFVEVYTSDYSSDGELALSVPPATFE